MCSNASAEVDRDTLHAYAPKGYVRVACDFHPAIRARPKMTRLSMVLYNRTKNSIWRFVGMHRECKISHVNCINTYLCFAFTILDSIWHWQERQMKEPEMCILSTILDEVQHPQYMSNNLSIRAWWLVLLPVSGFMAAMQCMRQRTSAFWLTDHISSKGFEKHVGQTKEVQCQ